MSLTLQGTCHCGNFSFVYQSQFSLEDLPKRRCGCSYCRRRAALYSADPAGSLSLHLQDPGLLSSYRFGHQTADFHSCAVCGILVAITCVVEGRELGIVNLLGVEQDWQAFPAALMDFEGEDPATRLARRQKSWIKKVKWIKGGPAPAPLGKPLVG